MNQEKKEHSTDNKPHVKDLDTKKDVKGGGGQKKTRRGPTTSASRSKAMLEKEFGPTKNSSALSQGIGGRGDYAIWPADPVAQGIGAPRLHRRQVNAAWPFASLPPS